MPAHKGATDTLFVDDDADPYPLAEGVGGSTSVSAGKPVASIATLADYLVNGFWQYNSAIAHHPGAFNAIAVDQRAAPVPCFADNAATAGPEFIVFRIARCVERDAGADEQRYATAQKQRAGKEHIIFSAALQFDSLPRFASIESCLNSRSIRIVLVERPDVGGGQ